MRDRARVLIADDHPPTRAGVRAALERAGFTICAELADAGSAVDAALRERPDICLLDIRMPGNGNHAAAAITARLPDTTVVMLTVSRDDEDLFEALRAGAAGYLLKDIPDDRLPHALERVLDGEAALPRSLVTRIVEEFRERDRRRIRLGGGQFARLTPRERDVLLLLNEGQTTAEIAKRLFIAPVTVRTHVASILRKLHVADRSAAVDLLSGTR